MNSGSAAYLASYVSYGAGLNSLHAYQASNSSPRPSIAMGTFLGGP